MRQNLKRFWLGFLCAFVLLQGSVSSLPVLANDTEDPVTQEPVEQGQDTDLLQETEEIPEKANENEQSDEITKAEPEQQTTDQPEEQALNQTPITGSASQNGVTVNVSAPVGSFPEGTTVSIIPLGPGQSQMALQGIETDQAVGFDISFYDGQGTKVQPNHSVDVSFLVNAQSEFSVDEKQKARLEVYHVSQEGSLEKMTEAPAAQQGTQLNMQANSFSAYILSKVDEQSTRQGDVSEKTDIQITDFTITNQDGSTPTTIRTGRMYHLNLTWDASAYENNLHAGDYFDITLPDTMQFPTNVSASRFNVLAPDGSVVARAVVDSNGSAGGGTVRVTFTDYVENRYNVSGTMYLRASFIKEKITLSENNPITIQVGTTAQTINVEVHDGTGTPNPLNPEEGLAKWGSITNDETIVNWTARINFSKQNLSNVVLTDTLFTEEGSMEGLQYVPGSFILRTVVLNEYGSEVERVSEVNVSDLVTFNADHTSFTLNLDQVDGDQLILKYQTTYLPGSSIRLRNRMTLNADEIKTWTTENGVQSQSSGGTGQGNLSSRIQIIKVDAEDHSIVLAGAVFQITDQQGNAFTLVTGQDGTVTSERLKQGTYHVEEIQAPAGYLLMEDQSSFDLEVTSQGGAIRTVENKRERIDIPVTKQWVGNPTDSVDIQLMADGTMVDTISLSADNDWTYTFTDLPKYDIEDGHEILYSVEENTIEGYTTGISGDAENGFVITNTEQGKVSVPVTKKWIGTPTDSVTVDLLANGKKVDSITLNADNKWQYTFTDLEKKENGKDIEYTIEEQAVEGYTVSYDGDAAKGFTITNKKDPNEKNPKSPTKKKGSSTAANTGNKVIYQALIAGSLVLLWSIRKKQKEK